MYLLVLVTTPETDPPVCAENHSEMSKRSEQTSIRVLKCLFFSPFFFYILNQPSCGPGLISCENKPSPSPAVGFTAFQKSVKSDAILVLSKNYESSEALLPWRLEGGWSILLGYVFKCWFDTLNGSLLKDRPPKQCAALCSEPSIEFWKKAGKNPNTNTVNSVSYTSISWRWWRNLLKALELDLGTANVGENESLGISVYLYNARVCAGVCVSNVGGRLAE